MAKKIYLGKVKNDLKNNMVSGESLWLEFHSWDCEWYWGFGYIGNRNLHCHFDGAFMSSRDGQDPNLVASEIFVDPVYSDSTWWVIRDLFKQAYALKACAETYRYGGHQTSKKGVTDILKDDEMCKRLNADLESVLNKVWEVLENEKLR